MRRDLEQLRVGCAKNCMELWSAGQEVCGRRDKKFVESGRKSLPLGEIRDSFFVDHQTTRRPDDKAMAYRMSSRARSTNLAWLRSVVAIVSISSPCRMTPMRVAHSWA